MHPLTHRNHRSALSPGALERRGGIQFRQAKGPDKVGFGFTEGRSGFSARGGVSGAASRLPVPPAAAPSSSSSSSTSMPPEQREPGDSAGNIPRIPEHASSMRHADVSVNLDGDSSGRQSAGLARTGEGVIAQGDEAAIRARVVKAQVRALADARLRVEDREALSKIAPQLLPQVLSFRVISLMHLTVARA